jgi:hypothetical protein
MTEEAFPCFMRQRAFSTASAGEQGRWANGVTRMNDIYFKKAYYIKLGEKGQWEKSSLAEGKLRIGWPGQSLKDINGAKWDIIRSRLAKNQKDKGALTRDLNALRKICESTSDDLWVTFCDSRLWWCRVGLPEILEDTTSKYRVLLNGWSDKDIYGKVISESRIPGILAKTQRFPATACDFKHEEAQSLWRLINNEPSSEYICVRDAKASLVQSVEKAIRKLHWKDFELFVDLLFRQSGWRRLSVLGQSMKFVDLELEDPITGDKYQVQVKLRATLADFKRYATQFSPQGYRRFYFVVASPDQSLAVYNNPSKDVELLLPKRLSEMAVDLGLVNWLLNRIM